MFSNVVYKIDSAILIDENAFFEWVNHKNEAIIEEIRWDKTYQSGRNW